MSLDESDLFLWPTYGRLEIQEHLPVRIVLLRPRQTRPRLRADSLDPLEMVLLDDRDCTPKALRSLLHLAPDVAVVDMSDLASANVFGILRRIHGSSPRTRVIVIGPTADVAFRQEARRGGATAALPCHVTGTVLVTILKGLVRSLAPNQNRGEYHSNLQAGGAV